VTEATPGTAGPLVRCDDVAKTYGRGTTAVVALHGATCEVHPGQSIAVTGPSGSGKSTLLHLLAGLDTPTSGRVTWPAVGDRASLRPGPVGMVFQGPSLLPALTAVENVAIAVLLTGRSEADAQRAALEALDVVGLGGLGAKLPEELSGGQGQRVAVARALAGRPRLILADEPTGQLDHTAGALVVTALLDAAQRLGAGLVVTTHDPSVADRLRLRWEVRDGCLSAPASSSVGGVGCSA
jgi:putative ABC transport system ATP-binding protein